MNENEPMTEWDRSLGLVVGCTTVQVLCDERMGLVVLVVNQCWVVAPLDPLVTR